MKNKSSRIVKREKTKKVEKKGERYEKKSIKILIKKKSKKILKK